MRTPLVVLGDLADSIGITSVTGEDELYVFPRRLDAERLGARNTVSLLLGDMIRDHSESAPVAALWPYDIEFRLLPEESIPSLIRLLWPCKASISQRRRFGIPMLQKGAKWYEWQELYHDKLRTPLPSPSPKSPRTTISCSTGAAMCSNRQHRHQAVRRRHRGRPPRPARPAQQFHGLLLVEAGMSE